GTRLTLHVLPEQLTDSDTRTHELVLPLEGFFREQHIVRVPDVSLALQSESGKWLALEAAGYINCPRWPYIQTSRYPTARHEITGDGMPVTKPLRELYALDVPADAQEPARMQGVSKGETRTHVGI